MKRKPHKVSEVDVGLPAANVDVWFDRDQLDFFVNVGLESVRADSVDAVKLLARQRFNNWTPETWEKIIVVEGGFGEGVSHVHGTTTENASVRLEFHRIELSKNLDGSQVCRPFGGGRTVRAHVEGTEKLPYSDELWAALLEIKASIEDAGKKLDAILSSPDAAERLSAMGRGLLAAGGIVPALCAPGRGS